MRTLIIILALFSAMVSFSQTTTTATFVVKGNCGECKTNIENAADIKGVKILNWNEKSKLATVTFDAQKVSLQQIKEAIAAKGYDAGDVSGNERAYQKLPKCCRYRDAACSD